MNQQYQKSIKFNTLKSFSVPNLIRSQKRPLQKTFFSKFLKLSKISTSKWFKKIKHPLITHTAFNFSQASLHNPKKSQSIESVQIQKTPDDFILKMEDEPKLLKKKTLIDEILTIAENCNPQLNFNDSVTNSIKQVQFKHDNELQEKQTLNLSSSQNYKNSCSEKFIQQSESRCSYTIKQPKLSNKTQKNQQQEELKESILIYEPNQAKTMENIDSNQSIILKQNQSQSQQIQSPKKPLKTESFQLPLSGPSKNQEKNIQNEFETLYWRTIPEQEEEGSSKSMAESVYDQIDADWQRLSNGSESSKISNNDLKARGKSQILIKASSKDYDQQTSYQQKGKQKKESTKKQNEDLVYFEEQYQNGGKYCGYMKNGERNGFGKFFYKHGGYYEGMWKNNAMNGQGKLYYDNGRLAYEGQWYQNQFHGKGKVYNDSAKPMENYFDYRDFNQNIQNFWQHYEGSQQLILGQLSHDTKVGFGKIFLSNGEYFEGMFRNDNVHGKGKFYSYRNEGEVIRGIWNGGILVQVIEILPKSKLCVDYEQQVIEKEIPFPEYQQVQNIYIPDEQKASLDNSKMRINQQNYENDLINREQLSESCPIVDQLQRQISSKLSINEMGTIAISQELDTSESFGEKTDYCIENQDQLDLGQIPTLKPTKNESQNQVNVYFQQLSSQVD